MPRVFTPPDTCPVCGEAVPRGAKACPGCGADERSGWNEDAARYDDLDLPDSAFTDDATPAPPRRTPGGKLRLVLVAVGLVILLLLLIFS